MYVTTYTYNYIQNLSIILITTVPSYESNDIHDDTSDDVKFIIIYLTYVYIYTCVSVNLSG